MLQPLYTLRRADQAAGAAAHGVSGFAQGGAAAFGAGVGEPEGHSTRGPLRQVNIRNLRDHVTCTIDLHPVAHPHIAALADRAALGVTSGDVILIVQRRVRHHDTAHRHRRQPRHGRQRPGPADLDVDGLCPRPGQFGGKLVRNRPARGGRAEPQAGLQGQVIDLVDDAVDVIAQGRPLRLDQRVMVQQPGRAQGADRQAIGLESHRVQTCNRSGLCGRQRRRDFPPGIGKEPQGARGGDAGVKLPQAARSGVARVGKGLVPPRRLPRVQGGKVGVRHIDLATHLQHLRCPDQALRDVGNGAGIGCHILASLAVAPGRRLHQTATFIAQGQGKPVDLRLGGIDDLAFMVQEAADSVVEIGHILGCKGVFQRQHRHGMGNLAEPFGHRGAHNARRAAPVARHQIGKGRFQRRQPPLHRVITGIAEGRRVVAVIGQIRAGDPPCQIGPFRGRLRPGHFADGCAAGHPPSPPPCPMNRVRAGSGQVRPRWPDAASPWPAPDRAAHSRGPRPSRYSSARPSPRPVSCATCR